MLWRFLFAILTIASLANQAKASESNTIKPNTDGLPVGFNRQAGLITFDPKTHEPKFNPVPTITPVLHFTGYNIDRSMLAYTTLEKLKEGEKQNRIPISLAESFNEPLDHLVPTGELVIQQNSAIKTLSIPGNEMATFAAWSPVDPNTIAYSYARLGTYGIATINIENGKRSVVVEGDFSPDYIAWNPEGTEIGVFVNGPALSGEAPVPDMINDEQVDTSKHWEMYRIDDGTVDMDVSTLAINNISISPFDASMDIFLQNSRISIPDVMGGDNVVLEKTYGHKVKKSIFRADQIRHRSQNGIAYVNFDGNTMTLWATNGLQKPHRLAANMSLEYYLPFASVAGANSVTITQGGVGYTGGACQYNNHTGSLSFAIDMQLPWAARSSDTVVVSTAATTYNATTTVTCNCNDSGADGTNCGIYDPQCKSVQNGKTVCNASAGGGWGNWVIMAHADGKYTKYAHLEAGTVAIHTSGTYASAGCYIADEGGTGLTSGGKNGCGDHLHFQWQSSGGRNDSSVSGSFKETGIINSSSCKTWTPTLTAQTCQL